MEYLVIPVITGWSGSTVCIPMQHSLGDTLSVESEKHKARGNKFFWPFVLLRSKLSLSPLAAELLCSSRSDNTMTDDIWLDNTFHA